ncbi:MAG: hypothetical protein Pg6C_17110 [Treponemataceae bacterium]|nr:MAG: hypothetical protein Pg6C_17110 [Treponemataceae bacterium]
MLSKGGKLPVGSIREWGGVKYVKTAPGKWRKLVAEKEPWGSSDEKAKELKLSDFGTPEEVREMAKMPVEARGYAQVRGNLLEIVGKPIRSKSGLTATITRNSIDKLLSGKSVEGSFEKQAHLNAAANIAKLFPNAIEPWEFRMNPEKSNADIKAVRRLYAPMYFNNRIVPVKITVKEMKNLKDGNRIYTLRAIDIDLDKNIGM